MKKEGQYLLTQNLENAIIHLETAKKFAPESALVRWNESRLLMHQKKFDPALTLAQKTHEQFPADIEGLVILGSCLRMTGDFNESLKYLSRAIKLNSNNAEALINRGLIWLKQEEKSRALIDLEKAYQLKPHIKQIWHLVISLKMEKKEFAETIVLSEEMAKIDPLDEKILKEANIEEVETVFALTEDDEDNIMACVLAEKYTPSKRTIAIINKQNYNILQESLKIDDLVDPRMATVSTIMKHVHMGTIDTVYSLLDGQYEFLEAKILESSELVNKSIKDSNLPDQVRIGAIVRNNKVMMPSSKFIFEKDDIVIVLSKREQLKDVEDIFRITS